MIAIDTSVLIDLIGEDARAAAAEDAVRGALSQGPVVACEVVVSEVVAGLGHGSILVDMLEEAGIGFVPLEQRSAVRAGEMQRLRALPAEDLAERRPAFSDPRLDELLLRFCARNHPDALGASELSRWRAHCRQRWEQASEWLARVEALEGVADERGRKILAELRRWQQQAQAQSAAP